MSGIGRSAPLLALAMAMSAGCTGDGGPVGEPARSAPWGSWHSPLAAARLAGASVAMSDLKVADGRLWWRESRPDQGGRQVLMRRDADGSIIEYGPDGAYVRTRVHEYGGASYLPTAEGLIYSHFPDQRLYLSATDAAPRPLTAADHRFADCVRDPARPRLLCVREDHTAATLAANGEERNEIVAVSLAGDTEVAGEVLVTGSDFVAYPRPSPDGRWLAWVTWNHPDMPWDASTLHLAELREDGLGTPRLLAGGPGRAVTEPQWDGDGSLYFIDDPDGWWNLYRWRDGEIAAVAPMAREFGGALWSHGASTYALTGDGRAVVRTSLAGIDRLGLLDLRDGSLRDFDLPFVAFSDVVLLDTGTAAAFAGAVDQDTALISVDLATGSHRVLHRPVETGLPAALISRAQAIEFPTAPGPDGAPRTAHAFFYPPTHPDHEGPPGTLPPLIVTVHGGPTSVAKSSLSLNRQFWTSRGFALVDVNYGGSTTFGRAYRERLNGQWGVVDVADALAAVDHLVATGRVDPARVAIRGGSAGGFTVLSALAFGDRFTAGANWYGVSDIKALAATSHKFERNYDVALVGPPDEALYRSRSPLFHLDGFTEPLITLQGSEDRIVPPDQSRAIVAALRERGVPVAYLEFEGEQHGFRKAENIIRAHEAELYFYGRVFGFTPAGDLAPVPIWNLDADAGTRP
ncbi:MAG: S9 family peptidase [Xanthomonadales bacterium]|nr:S9 family peptidase [Xanthomonadales bacterium]